MLTNKSLLCLTPIKNEAWILNMFLNATNQWANRIIIADQLSSDSSRVIVSSYDNVEVVVNNSTTFNELNRQTLLLNHARKHSKNAIILALDADEFLPLHFKETKEWQKAIKLENGTVFMFKLMNICPDLKTFWSPDIWFPLGFIDDGSIHVGKSIHSPRVPIKDDSKKFFFHDIKIMHLQYVNWNRMKSKQRWYQCWELLNNKRRTASSIYRQYHHMDVIRKSEIHSIPSEYLSSLKKQGVNLKALTKETNYWWDKEVLRLFNTYGASIFSNLDLWDEDWINLAIKHNVSLKDSVKKQLIEKKDSGSNLIRYLRHTQRYYPSLLLSVLDRIVETIHTIC